MSHKTKKMLTTTKPGSSSRDNLQSPPRNRFQKEGSQALYEMIDTKEACVYRIDMPGCRGSDLTYRVESDVFHFSAEEPAKLENNYAGRNYGGTIEPYPKAYDVKEAKVKLVNGVMWVTVPKIIGAEVDPIEKMMYSMKTKEEFMS